MIANFLDYNVPFFNSFIIFATIDYALLIS